MTLKTSIRNAGIPENVNASELHADLRALPGVLEVHDLHVWSISVNKPALSCHLLVQDRASAKGIFPSPTPAYASAKGILPLLPVALNSNRDVPSPMLNVPYHCAPQALLVSF
jgi:hypothetical protein